MLKRLFVLIFTLSAVLAFTAPPRMAVGDFSVTSDNPKLKYIGKGLAEMIAAELSTSKGVTLIAREKRDKLLEEMKFSLSGLADESSAIEIGELLSANYILFGDIIDMDSVILISCKLVNTETGEVIWQGTHTGALADYSSISKKLAGEMLRGMGADKAAELAEGVPVTAPAVSSEQKVEAILAFSGAVDSLDKNDKESAKKQLETAKAIDPRNPAVVAYLAKLVTNTSKFNILLPNYSSYNNPATLGIIRQDSFHLVTSIPAIPVYYMPLIEWINYAQYGDGRYVNETTTTVNYGYSIPLGDSMGLRISLLQNFLDVRTKIGEPPTSEENSGGNFDYSTARIGEGLSLGFGIKVVESFALGAEVSVLARSEASSGPFGSFLENDGMAWAINAGFLLRNRDESAVWDTRVNYVRETYELVKESDLTMTGTSLPWPLGIENNLVLAFGGKTFFLNLKNIETIDLSGAFVAASLMPAFEYFIADWFSVRGGVEGSGLFSSDAPNFGLGGMVGATFRIIPWGLDLDFNYSYRMRPSTAVPGYLYPDFLFLMNVNWNGVFKKSR